MKLLASWPSQHRENENPLALEHVAESFSTESPSLSTMLAVIGQIEVACSLTLIGLTLLGSVLAASGVLTALTGLIGFCPACAMAGRKSLEGPR